MGERLKRIWAGYQKYKLITRIIAAFVGASVGISGCATFAKVYGNYDAATWAAVSAAVAIVFIHLHFAVRRDRHERNIPREKFTLIMFIGALAFFAGLAGFITYLVLGATHHESGVHANGYYVVCVWNFMTLKWGFFTFMAARGFRKKYFDLDPQVAGLVQEA